MCGQAKPTGEVEIHNAGHCPAILVGHGGVLRVESTGLPLGMFHNTEFSATRVQLDPGDTLFLYTDGLSEARHADEEYGVERVLTLVRQQAGRQPAELITACLEDLRVFTKGERGLDDLTLLAISGEGKYYPCAPRDHPKAGKRMGIGGRPGLRITRLPSPPARFFLPNRFSWA